MECLPNLTVDDALTIWAAFAALLVVAWGIRLVVKLLMQVK